MRAYRLDGKTDFARPSPDAATRQKMILHLAAAQQSDGDGVGKLSSMARKF